MPRSPDPLGDPTSLSRYRGGWRLRYYPGGVVTASDDRKVYGVYKTAEEAERVRAHLRSVLVRERAVLMGDPSARLVVDVLDDAERRWRQTHNATGRTNASRIRTTLGRIPGAETMSIGELVEAGELLDQAIENATRCDGRPLKASTLSAMRSSWLVFGDHLVADGVVEANPFELMRAKTNERRRKKKAGKRAEAIRRAQRSSPFDDDAGTESGISLRDVPTPAHVVALRDAIIVRETKGPPQRSGSRELGGAAPVDAAVMEHLAEFVTLKMASGLRFCELLAVHTSRVVPERLEIVVDRQLDRYAPSSYGDDGRWLPPLVPPKHDKQRVAKVWPAYRQRLAELCDYADEFQHGWLFPPPRRQVWWPKAVEGIFARGVEQLAWEQEEAERAGAPTRDLHWTWTPHFLRHAYASYSLAGVADGGLGWSTRFVQESMGHDEERTTLSTYRHVLDEEAKRNRHSDFAWAGL